MSFIAEFSVEIQPLSRASKAVPEMRFTGEDIVIEGDVPRKFVFAAHGTRFDEFEAALERDPTVARYEVLQRGTDRAYYVVTYDTEAVEKGTYHIAVEHDIVFTDITLCDGEYTVQARVPDRESLKALRQYCRENTIPFRLRRIYREAGPAGAGSGLTDAQRQALRLAYERGYFDTPRETTLAELGEELGISRQALAERLRRGHRRLIEATVA